MVSGRVCNQSRVLGCDWKLRCEGGLAEVVRELSEEMKLLVSHSHL